MKNVKISAARALRVACFAVGAAAIVGPWVGQSNAALFTLVDDNSVVEFNTSSAANNFDWKVDGISQLAQQAFWYRIGATAESSVHTLPIGAQGVTDVNFDGNSDFLFVRYLGAGFTVETRYSLDGGTLGSGLSDLGEQISIINTGSVPLDFHFYQYANFNLEGTVGGDVATFTNPNAVQQTKGISELSETVITPIPSHRELGFLPTTLAKLTDAFPTDLSDTPLGVSVGPGDVTWAFQWDFTLPVGGNFQISKDKNIHFIPEPGVVTLLPLVGGFLMGRRRRVA